MYCDLKVIANNMKNYIPFWFTKTFKDTAIRHQFIDSYQFLPSSLHIYGESLPENKFEISKENVDSHDYKLLLRKEHTRKNTCHFQYIWTGTITKKKIRNFLAPSQMKVFQMMIILILGIYGLHINWAEFMC